MKTKIKEEDKSLSLKIFSKKGHVSHNEQNKSAVKAKITDGDKNAFVDIISMKGTPCKIRITSFEGTEVFNDEFVSLVNKLKFVKNEIVEHAVERIEKRGRKAGSKNKAKIEAVITLPKKRGRKAGSKNKATIQAIAPAIERIEKRGRKKGSLNKVKTIEAIAPVIVATPSKRGRKAGSKNKATIQASAITNLVNLPKKRGRKAGSKNKATIQAIAPAIERIEKRGRKLGSKNKTKIAEPVVTLQKVGEKKSERKHIKPLHKLVASSNSSKVKTLVHP